MNDMEEFNFEETGTGEDSKSDGGNGQNESEGQDFVGLKNN